MESLCGPGQGFQVKSVQLLDNTLNGIVLTSQHAGGLEEMSTEVWEQPGRWGGGVEERDKNSCTADQRCAWPVGHATGVSEVCVKCVESTHGLWSCCAGLGNDFTLRQSVTQ